MSDRSAPIHPGEVLLGEFLVPHGVTPYKLAKRIGVPVGRITAIIAGKRAITADTAVRLGRFFGTSADLWLGLQVAWELESVAGRRWIEANIVPLSRSESAADVWSPVGGTEALLAMDSEAHAVTAAREVAYSAHRSARQRVRE